MGAVEQVVVVGASGFGRESLDVLDAMVAHGSPVRVRGVVDDAPSIVNLERLKRREIAYIGTIDDWVATGPSDRFVLAIGHPQTRRRLVEKFDTVRLSAFDAIHPSALIGGGFSYGEGVVICAGANISTNVTLGRHVHLNPGVIVGHDAELRDFVSANPGAVLSGEVTVETEALIGAGAIILQTLTIAEGVVVGAAALVTKSPPAGVVVKGIPGVWGG